MASRNEEMEGTAFAIFIVGAAVFCVAAFVFAVLAFAACILTILALCAWFRPITLFGQTVEPADARMFVGFGVVGAAVFPAFAAFTAALFHFQIPEEFWRYLFIGGYSVGSVVIAGSIQNQRDEQAAQAAQELLPPLQQYIVPTQLPPSARPQRPFEYARWDDEEDAR